MHMHYNFIKKYKIYLKTKWRGKKTLYTPLVNEKNIIMVALIMFF